MKLRPDLGRKANRTEYSAPVIKSESKHSGDDTKQIGPCFSCLRESESERKRDSVDY